MNYIPLGELVDIKGGGTPNRKIDEYWGGDIPWATVKDFKSTELSTTQERITELGVSKSATNVIRKGTIVVPTRMAVGKAAITKIDMAINQDLKALLVKDKNKVDTQYLLRFLLAKSSVLESMGKGATVKGITLDVLRSLEIPLPPLAEQKRIAAILDKADAIRRKRQQAIQLADQFLRAVFLDMFGDPVTNPKGWDEIVLGDVIEFAKDGPHVSPKYSEHGIPFLSTRHVKPTGVVWEDLKFITPDEADIHWKKCKPSFGDILYTKGGTTGIACPVDFEKDFAVWVHVALLRPIHTKVNFIWLSNMLNSKYCYLQSQKHTRGATNKDLGLTRMVDIKMYYPPLELQNKFVDVICKLKSISSIAEKSSNETLFESFSQKAFAGKL